MTYDIKFSHVMPALALFPGSLFPPPPEEEREPGTHYLCMCQVPIVTCILLHYTKIMVNTVYLLKGRTAWLYSLWDAYRWCLSWKQYRFDGNCLHWFVGSNWWTSKEEVCQSRATVFNWNAWMRGQFLQMKSWVPSSFLHHHLRRVWSVTGIF